MDVTHIYGRAHLAAISDCHDRELVGDELALGARAKEAKRALERRRPREGRAA
jgi:putative transposase